MTSRAAAGEIGAPETEPAAAANELSDDEPDVAERDEDLEDEIDDVGGVVGPDGAV